MGDKLFNRIYMNFINYIYEKTRHISEDFKAKIVVFSFFMLFINMFLSTAGVYKGSTSVAALIGVIITFVIILFSVSEKIEKIEINKNLLILLYIISGFFLISGILHRVMAYILCSLIFAVLFPVFYIIFNSENGYSKFLLSFNNGIKYSFILLIIVSVFISPLTSGQYASFLANPNGLGAYLTIVLPALLYLFEAAGDKTNKILNIILIGCVFALSVFVKSRTTYLSFIFIGVVYILYLFINRINIKEILFRLFKIILSSVLGTVMLFSMLTYVNNFIINIEKNVFGNAFIVTFNDEGKNEGFMTLIEQLNSAADRSKKGITDDNNLSSGRFEIWGKYINNINLLGHPAGKLKVPYQGGYIEANSHNSYLQVAYAAGIIAGLSFFIMNILFLIYLLRIIFKGIKNRNLDIKYLFIGSMLIGCEITMVLSSVYYPYISAISIVYYFVIGFIYIENMD
ncbi:O-antigen ligase family protein [Anaerofustis stercorihominis]|uniref:O-antigen ligase-related domain-containing protein n=3 Tax=Anaerofustis stercorihominis TaxID=214853 RepID=B1CBD4_9FIRM|nr:O-antigen ligase family protein [Anaerofustis stercorihominis]EDS71581.1 hypothetical protein ANASTE_01283 [Anaerofustis stercorihominis DSM 17244]MCQ4796360.1 O-antigen ligase family protein [Anaerofustis stercorihominis]